MQAPKIATTNTKVLEPQAQNPHRLQNTSSYRIPTEDLTSKEALSGNRQESLSDVRGRTHSPPTSKLLQAMYSTLRRRMVFKPRTISLFTLDSTSNPNSKTTESHETRNWYINKGRGWRNMAAITSHRQGR